MKKRTRKTAPKPRAKAAFTITVPALAKGDRYAGILLDDKGRPAHHVFLLAGERDGLKWPEAQAWAKAQGGELPTRKEQALLFANAASEFKPGWPAYWSNEKHASNGEYAWCQNFYYGYQVYGHQDGKLRARAVRRVPIQPFKPEAK